MKSLLRKYLFNLVTLWITTQVVPGLSYSGGFNALLLGALGLMVVNWFILPLLKITFLPFNLLTLGFFTWIVNVIGLYIMTKLIPQFKLVPFSYPSINYNGFVIPEIALNVLMVAIAASLLIGLISNFLHWLTK